MKTVRDVLLQVKKMGLRCTERTFWHYHKLRLLPEGQKISGRGNVVFFPDDTAHRIWLIVLLTKEFEFSIPEVCRYPWSQLNIRDGVKSIRQLPEDFVFAAKQKLQKSRDDSLKHIVANIGMLIGAGDMSGDSLAVNTRGNPESGNPVSSKQNPNQVHERGQTATNFNAAPVRRADRSELLPDNDEIDVEADAPRRSNRSDLLP